MRSLPLPIFASSDTKDWTIENKKIALHAPQVKRVVSFTLGPEGTNIEQAAILWHKQMEIGHKAAIERCDLPETAVARAIEENTEGTLAVFWTCAVFARLNQVFFNNTSTFPFFFPQEMLLDDMQLAVRNRIIGNVLREWGNDTKKRLGIRIATHVSPAPLLEHLKNAGASLVNASSNSEAARMCKAGEVEACMTTESARIIYELTALHRFGSPLMVFFGGVTLVGLHLLEQALEGSTYPVGFIP